MGSAIVHGFQGSNPNEIDQFHVFITAKHYLEYGNPNSGKDRTPVIIPVFQKLIESNVATVLVNSGIINGIPIHSSHFFIITNRRS
jgi:beta-glucosidase